MSVQTFNPTDLSQSTANWAVAQRIVGPFAPHAQVSPDLTIALDPGYLLNGTTLTEVKAQVVGPFAPPASGFRIDRVVVDRATGTASVVVGTANSLTPPAIPFGKLPITRVFLDSTTETISNEAITDERALFDQMHEHPKVYCRAHLGGTDQTGIAANSWTKVNLSTIDFNVGNGFDVANKWFKPSISGYYRIRAQTNVAITSGHNYGVMIYKNGVGGAYWGASASMQTGHTAAVEDVLYLNGSTDYVEMYAVNSNAATTFYGNKNATFLVASLLD
ncbi:hypothetical protein JJL56_14815 [Azospirillum sp. YIM DDC1]|jgi:hypothetical protein|uniref:C1q domain-containing protein n=1 Tax=Azospirillum aestuarii TaxID=2802052 RepID=A0ABS1HZ89_9PROT|nr:hypothetical protein [Azospirillum aestuarii]MBK4720144.1 hypothetical protein [Azospirillum aestuarii]TWA88437.1 hypothetical protein FBY14_108199 [Azospirillum brasilense]